MMTMKLNKEYWEERYEKGETGWNVGKITTPIKEYIDQLKDKNVKILIPGAGNGYELEYLIEKGFKNSSVVDYATTPLENIKKRIPELDKSQIINADFFELEGQYDLIIEQTFFCALNPDLRQAYVQKMKALLNIAKSLAITIILEINPTIVSRIIIIKLLSFVFFFDKRKIILQLCQPC